MAEIAAQASGPCCLTIVLQMIHGPLLVELCILRSAVGRSPVARQPRPGGAASGAVAARWREAYIVPSGRGRFSCGDRAAAEARTAGRNTEATSPMRPATAKAIIASP